jgi:AcrR family transcriptional regulator
MPHSDDEVEAMEERSRRIVESAMALAEQGGFEAVRLRDVAAHAEVALGTLYRRFRSKEDLLIAALDLETKALARRVEKRPPEGETELGRVVSFFSIATRGMLARPDLARAMVKATASGDLDLTKKVASFHSRVEKMVVDALRGPNAKLGPDEPPGDAESRLAVQLNLFWFALMVGWSGGLYSQSEVLDEMGNVAVAMLRGSAK